MQFKVLLIFKERRKSIKSDLLNLFYLDHRNLIQCPILKFSNNIRFLSEEKDVTVVIILSLSNTVKIQCYFTMCKTTHHIFLHFMYWLLWFALIILIVKMSMS